MRDFRRPSISEFFNNICAFETFERRLESTFSRHSGSRLWKSQLGGKRAYRDSLGKDRSPPKAACLRPNPTAHSSGIPALRRPSDDRSIISTKRGSPPSDIWDVFHAAIVLNGAVEGGAR
jgi:hypothetical protein